MANSGGAGDRERERRAQGGGGVGVGLCSLLEWELELHVHTHHENDKRTAGKNKNRAVCFLSVLVYFALFVAAAMMSHVPCMLLFWCLLTTITNPTARMHRCATIMVMLRYHPG